MLAWQTWRKEHVHPFEKRLLRPLAAAALMLIAMHLAVPWLGHGAWTILLLLGGAGVYVTTLLALGLAPEERALLAGRRARLRRAT
jgi:hypothetical protein